MTNQPNDEANVWALVALMGHIELAGRLSKPTDWGGLFQLDVPEGDTFQTELFSPQAVFDIKIVSEEIARAYARRSRVISAYDAPIITREQHEAVTRQARLEYDRVSERVRELERRLTAVNALPAPKSDEDEQENYELEGMGK